MTVLTYKPCACLTRGVAFVPGTRGHLFARIGKREILLQRCRYCRRKDENLQGKPEVSEETLKRNQRGKVY